VIVDMRTKDCAIGVGAWVGCVDNDVVLSCGKLVSIG
jgi:hypothetical protein